ncbi:poly(A)-binding protein binding protein [Podospora pseudoanserina]|uniref:Poly(A)-binding protein binding protein n=1 Tax=Podospora pseudoanserina TaxID=2609844 RepID=A0ABR0IE12_9PEZI|nr:poly(A)-binding protein binding protein [Podospora pseudoanserina]
MEDRSSTPSQSTSADVKSPTQRPLYSSKLGDQRKEVTPSGQTARQTPPVTKAWTPASRNPVTGRSQPPQAGFNSQNRQSVTNSLREGQRVRVRYSPGAEFSGTCSNDFDSGSFRLTNVLQKKLPNSADLANGARRDQTQMMAQKKDVMDARVVPGNAGKNDGKGANGNRSGFKTDASISNSRLGAGRALQPWTPPPDTTTDLSLESSKEDVRGWDQFATHERMFGNKSTYDERIYTTEIDRSHPNYEQRIAQADKIARQIEGEAPKFAHVAEERIMDFGGGGDGRDEEENGVARQDFPPLSSNRENKYTPPARRAPTGQSTVKGAPVDPAIISSQLKGAPASTQPTPKVEDVKSPAATPTPAQPAVDKAAEPKAESKASEKAPETKPDVSAAPAKADPKETVAARSSTATARVGFPGASRAGGPSAANNVEREVLNAFKQFSIKERKQADAARHSKARVDKEVKLTELKKFSKDFKLSTPVPKDLIPIIAKDPVKQQEIQEKAIQNAAEIARKKQEAAAKEKESAAAKVNQAKTPAEQSNASTPAATTDSRASSRPTAPQHSNSSGAPGRHPGGRASYHNSNGIQPPYGQYNRNGRGAQLPPGAQATGQLAQRLRNVEQQKMQHPHMAQHPQPDMRLPPTGPANNADPNYGRRISGVPPTYLGPKLNPNTQEFRPNAFAQPFNPMNPINPINAVIPSQASSPRASVNMMEVPIMAPPAPAKGQLVRRKTKAIDIKKCLVLSNMETIQPPTNPKKTWEENDGFRPAFDHPPTWRAVDPEKEEPKDSTMSMTYNEYFEKVPRAGATVATPNPTHAMPQIPHQHQLPPYLQHGGQGMAPRQSPHMPPMQMQAGQHGHGTHGPYNPDDHRMMHSNSAQSFASPRMGQVPMAYPPSVNAPGQMPYGQPVMPQYMNPGAPQMGQFRSFSNNPQFMPQQPHHMGAPMMGQPPFMPPNGMAVPGPMYPVSGPPFMPPGAVAPQPMVGSNGFPSPGRSAAAPMMAHQGSHQGQPAVYGMSPAMTYQQPAYTPQQGQGKFSGQRPPQ